MLNNQGVRIGHEEGIVTPEEARAKAEADKVAREIKERKDRDRYLLQTYQSVEEIQLLRDRRLELIECATGDPAAVARQPSGKVCAPGEAGVALPAAQPGTGCPAACRRVSRSILNAQRAISRRRMQNLAKKRLERDTIRANFEADIKRFEELRSVAPR